MARADHAVSLNMPAAITVGSRLVEVPVRRNGRRVGVLSISDKGVQWNPSTTRPPVHVGWEDLPTALASAATSSSTSATSAATTQASATSSSRSTARAAAPGSREKAAAKPSRGAGAPVETASAGERGDDETAAERPRTVGGSTARRKTAGAARRAGGRTETAASEVSAVADTSAADTSAPAAGAPPATDPTLDAGTGTGTGAGDSTHVPGQQPLPLDGLDTPGSTDGSPEPDTRIGTGSDATTPVATTAAEPAGREAAARKAAARKSAKKAPPRQAGEPAAREVTSAPARAGNVTVPGAGADTTPLDARAVRQWAAAHGITVPPRGPLSTRVREQYLAAQ
ncbi:Lsr2 family DNA-binding protein [Kineococcus radiotolerans]|uniref:Lsr2 DNA-binding domain-containing protein n=1 Tax=Kineococcus radiotolerans (strain ATCC BAA-149 / DSM 14245 / SRS30216) TaxID=266940 RepID=A6WBL4_KINRD|nr:Lsr2 family protein [Kineococcus radiotolerans]ABS04203.1 hypothetical protein Krad_2731 [Kineococcus radiotolerans SRS30216 = ATCC BAA-149]